MRKQMGVAFVVMLLVGFGLSQARAQQPPTLAVPQDELVAAWLDTAKIAAQLAQLQCSQLDSVKQFNRVQAETTTKVEKRLPGYTVNWQTFAVEAKKPAAK
jgi:hypothetical protein